MLQDHKYAPTFSLKKTGSSTLSIPPHQQKLTVGSIVLEDWDEDGNVLLLCNYPSIYDGVTIQFHLVTKYSYI